MTQRASRAEPIWAAARSGSSSGSPRSANTAWTASDATTLKPRCWRSVRTDSTVPGSSHSSAGSPPRFVKPRMATTSAIGGWSPGSCAAAGATLPTAATSRHTATARRPSDALAARNAAPAGLTLEAGPALSVHGEGGVKPKVSYRPQRGRLDEGPSKGPSVSRVSASLALSLPFPAAGCTRG